MASPQLSNAASRSASRSGSRSPSPPQAIFFRGSRPPSPSLVPGFLNLEAVDRKLRELTPRPEERTIEGERLEALQLRDELVELGGIPLRPWVEFDAEGLTDEQRGDDNGEWRIMDLYLTEAEARRTELKLWRRFAKRRAMDGEPDFRSVDQVDLLVAFIAYLRGHLQRDMEDRTKPGFEVWDTYLQFSYYRDVIDDMARVLPLAERRLHILRSERGDPPAVEEVEVTTESLIKEYNLPEAGMWVWMWQYSQEEAEYRMAGLSPPHPADSRKRLREDDGDEEEEEEEAEEEEEEATRPSKRRAPPSEPVAEATGFTHPKMQREQSQSAQQDSRKRSRADIEDEEEEEKATRPSKRSRVVDEDEEEDGKATRPSKCSAAPSELVAENTGSTHPEMRREKSQIAQQNSRKRSRADDEDEEEEEKATRPSKRSRVVDEDEEEEKDEEKKEEEATRPSKRRAAPSKPVAEATGSTRPERQRVQSQSAQQGSDERGESSGRGSVPAAEARQAESNDGQDRPRRARRKPAATANSEIVGRPSRSGRGRGRAVPEKKASEPARRSTRARPVVGEGSIIDAQGRRRSARIAARKARVSPSATGDNPNPQR
ncbi:uncharacterized protein THITE_116905 [Thermothielavioides terrestris NRRL 8126]|uniref:Uncharacterized protein n=1 Tax=Thermothielavioides terrestris (strain ATCC 38088 / NRRL 8126) TaxID=578455 RepID=G2RIH3_THETT|nr:uncharacterized protein THITE_116905 [Thermothielavioides terrestris NRRL 8126]AEO71635.1 hypothetical protein THITE_116905 [Thermothielavioides terrestris NRRL 8126]